MTSDLPRHSGMSRITKPPMCYEVIDSFAHDHLPLPQCTCYPCRQGSTYIKLVHWRSDTEEAKNSPARDDYSAGTLGRSSRSTGHEPILSSGSSSHHSSDGYNSRPASEKNKDRGRGDLLLPQSLRRIRDELRTPDLSPALIGTRRTPRIHPSRSISAV